MELADSRCYEDDPPNACLERANGILETRNPRFDIFVFWHPSDYKVLGPFTDYIQGLTSNNLEGACYACYDVGKLISDTTQSDVDEFFECVRGRLNSWRVPALAVLPTETLGYDCRPGWIWRMHLSRPAFEVTIVVLYP